MTETEAQLQQTVQQLIFERNVVIVLIVAFVLLAAAYIFLKKRLKHDGFYEWYNPERGWLNRTHFVRPPKISQIFWAQGGFWMIVKIDEYHKKLDVVTIHEHDILESVPPTKKGEKHVG